MKKIFFSALALGAFVLTVKGQSNQIQPTGDVGIGTTSPTAKLDVRGNVLIKESATKTFSIGANTVYSSGPSIYSSNDVGIFSGSGKITIGTSAGVSAEFAGQNLYLVGKVYPNGIHLSNGSNPTFEMNPGGTFWVNAPNIHGGRLSILPNGNVGIGVPVPGAKLHVDGLTLIGAEPNATQWTGINAAANCTTAPPLKLWVNGTIGTKELRVHLSSWCDYVFDNHFQLKPLSEVESYIKANKHLPEVPSEKEVTENGVAMGEMMKVHMKKIEELTLYAIEQNKRIQELEASSLKK